MERINSIRLFGRAKAEPVYDHSVYGEAFLRFELKARRLSGTEDVLPVTVSERLVGGAYIGEDTPIGLVGQIRSYNRRTEDRSRLILTVFARELFFGAEEAEDVNEAELSGNICKPVVYRTTPFSREIADLLIAVNRRYLKSDYLPAIAWGRNARFANGLLVGDSVRIRGRLQSRGYQKKLPDGRIEQRVAYEVSCSAIERESF